MLQEDAVESASNRGMSGKTCEQEDTFGVFKEVGALVLGVKLGL
jgi:hypothetical protein